MFYVYMHTVPNGKVYIGQTYNLEDRWSNGIGYEENRQFNNDIKKYGWENIKHEILRICETRSEALMYELAFIIIKDSENPEHGYNRTHNIQNCQDMLKNAVTYSPQESTHIRDYNKRNIFVEYGIPIHEAERIIDERVFSKRDRQILKRKLIDDITYVELVKEFKMSERQLKKICIDWQENIKEFL